MQRRNFIRWAAGAGLACTGLPLLGRADGLGGTAQPQASGEYTGPLLVTFSADGGWDTTLVCDPKPNLSRAYGNGGVATAGAIKYANVGNNAAFFDKYADQLLVLNGVDAATNNHRTGKRHTWTGRLDDGMPHVAALVAGSHAPQLPLSFIAEGPIDVTAGVVSRTRINNADALQDLAYPNLINPANVDDERSYHAEPTSEMIADWRARRLEAARDEQHLPRMQAALDNVATVRGGANELELLEAYLPDPLVGNGTRRKIQIALAAYKAGLAVSASFRHGSFDTHADNDAQQVNKLNGLLGHVDFLWEEATRQGIADQLVVVVGSDFARTPGYNARDGRDHWEIGSMMLMGAGIEGNRVIGATDNGLYAQKVDPETLELSSDGIRLKPQHVHRAVRELFGVSPVLDDRFAIDDVPLLPLFG